MTRAPTGNDELPGSRPSARRGLGTSTSFRPPYPVNDSARMALIVPTMSNLRVDASDRMPGGRVNAAKHGPSDRTEPGARRHRRRVDQPERRQREAQREENVGQVARRGQEERT